MAEAAKLAEEPAQSAPQSLGREHDLVIPRISVEAFCMTPDFATATQTAAQDRRMAKAKTCVGMGGAKSAAKRYANVGTPNLILVESLESGFGIFQELEALAEVCDPETRVIVAGPSNDVTLYRELIRQGVCEYLVTPAAPMQIIEAIATAYEDPQATPAGKTIAVFGVRGGSGSSVLAHNLAEMIAAQSEKDTVLVDLDLEFGTVALDFNIEAKSSVADALGDIEGLDDVKLARLLFQQDEHLKLLPAPPAIQSRGHPGEEEVLGLMDSVRNVADFVVLDIPNEWNSGTRCALRQADQVVLVATPDLVSLRNLKSVYDWLQAERQHDAAPKIVLNQVGQAKRPEIAATEFSEILNAEIDVTLPHEPAVFGAAQNEGKTLRHLPAAKRVVEQLEPMARSLAGIEKKAPRKSKGLAGWLGLG